MCVFGGDIEVGLGVALSGTGRGGNRGRVVCFMGDRRCLLVNYRRSREGDFDLTLADGNEPLMETHLEYTFDLSSKRQEIYKLFKQQN